MKNPMIRERGKTY